MSAVVAQECRQKQEEQSPRCRASRHDSRREAQRRVGCGRRGTVPRGRICGGFPLRCARATRWLVLVPIGDAGVRRVVFLFSFLVDQGRGGPLKNTCFRPGQINHKGTHKFRKYKNINKFPKKIRFFVLFCGPFYTPPMLTSTLAKHLLSRCLSASSRALPRLSSASDTTPLWWVLRSHAATAQVGMKSTRARCLLGFKICFCSCCQSIVYFGCHRGARSDAGKRRTPRARHEPESPTREHFSLVASTRAAQPLCFARCQLLVSLLSVIEGLKYMQSHEVHP